MSISRVSGSSSGYSPYAEIVSTMNEVTSRWQSVKDRAAVGSMEAVVQKWEDVNLRAVNSFFSGRVPERDQNIVSLVGKMTF